ncbi:hypothetical protein AAVH_08103 [Aphelenchoides avenae]|nr:hypothetical protein AAVH_08103 [Aphelenchus avenae]
MSAYVYRSSSSSNLYSPEPFVRLPLSRSGSVPDLYTSYRGHFERKPYTPSHYVSSYVFRSTSDYSVVPYHAYERYNPYMSSLYYNNPYPRRRYFYRYGQGGGGLGYTDDMFYKGYQSRTNSFYGWLRAYAPYYYYNPSISSSYRSSRSIPTGTYWISRYDY